MRFRSLTRAGALTSISLVAGCFEGPVGEIDGGPDASATSGDAASLDDSGSGDGTATTGVSSSDRGLPCEVEDVVDRNCVGCHDEMPIYGAPMSLYDVAAWRVPAHSDPTLTVAEMAAIRIVDDASPMPASGPLPGDDLAVLQAWIEAGTPESETGCGGNSGSDSDDNATDTGDTDPYDPPTPEDLPCEPTLVLAAHDGDDPFHVPAQGADNLYQCFSFASPLGAESQAIAWAPIVDDERVLHHWALYRSDTPQVDGGSEPCDIPDDAQVITAWGPGGDVYEFPENVGLDLGGDSEWFILQMHYNNSANYADVFDRSGIAMCVVDEPREHTAGIFTLGTANFTIPADVASYDAEGMCSSSRTLAMPEPLHVISAFPHMHARGTALRTDILRGGENGPEEVLVDQPNFSLENQVFLTIEPEILIEPGDALRTTCTWNNEGGEATGYGLGSEDEMCFDFVMVWPIEALEGSQLCI